VHTTKGSTRAPNTFVPTTELVESPTNVLQNINLLKEDGLEDKESCSVLSYTKVIIAKKNLLVKKEVT
jgi:hypothetical protein